MASRLTAAGAALIYAAGAALWIVASATLVTWISVSPEVQSKIEVAKGLAFVVLTSALLYALLRHRDRARANSATAADSVSRAAAPTIAVLVHAVPLIGFGAYTLFAEQQRAAAFADLRKIAEFKAEQIETWLAERAGDATSLANSPVFVEQAAAYVAGGGASALEAIDDRLGSLRKSLGYDAISLVDPAGIILYNAGNPSPLAVPVRAMLPQIAAAGAIRTGIFERDGAGNLHLNVIAPLRKNSGNAEDTVALVIMHIDPGAYLFPLIQAWPGASGSGEILLVRRQGDRVNYLSNLRFRADAALTLANPADKPDLPPAAALRDRRPGTTSGRDYRDVQVLAAYRPVTGTDWMLVAKIDREEALASARDLALWVTHIAALALAIVALAIVLLLRQQRRANALAAQAMREAQLQDFFTLPFVGMAITSPASKRWLRFNDRLCEILGYPRAVLAEKTWAELTHPQDLSKDMAEFDQVMRGGSDGYVLEKRFIRGDGEVITCNIDVKCIRHADGAIDYFVLTVDDITRRKQTEARLLTVTSFHAALSQCNMAIVHATSEKELLPAVCRAVLAVDRVKFVWIALADAAGSIVPAAWAGHGADYLSGLHIPVAPDDPRGQGPTGIAVREGVPYWCDDFQNDPHTAPWRARGAPFDWRAAAGLPLRRDGVPVGALTIYLDVKDPFDEKIKSLLLEMAEDVSYALDGFVRNSERQKAELALRRFNQVAVDRELAMIDLKRQVNGLSLKLGLAAPFNLTFADAPPAAGNGAQDAPPPAAGAPP